MDDGSSAIQLPPRRAELVRGSLHLCLELRDSFTERHRRSLPEHLQRCCPKGLQRCSKTALNWFDPRTAVVCATSKVTAPSRRRVHLTFFGEVCLSPMHLVRFRRRVRLMILDQATIEALETPNSSDARKREIKSTKKHETHPRRQLEAQELRRYATGRKDQPAPSRLVLHGG